MSVKLREIQCFHLENSFKFELLCRFCVKIIFENWECLQQSFIRGKICFTVNGNQEY